MWADTFDWTVSRALAAAEKVPWSAIATKLCNCLISTGETSFPARFEPISKNDSNYRPVQLE
jgi:hypothetical protein